jgi:hypothetical protein
LKSLGVDTGHPAGAENAEADGFLTCLAHG